MSAKRVRLQRRTSGRPIPIEIERFAAGCGSQPHALKPRITAAIGDQDGRSWRHVLDLGHEAAGADDARAVKIFDRERSSDLVVACRNPQRLVLVDAGRAVRRISRPKAKIERGLQRSGIVGGAIANGCKPTVFHAYRIIVGK